MSKPKLLEAVQIQMLKPAMSLRIVRILPTIAVFPTADVFRVVHVTRGVGLPDVTQMI